MSDTHKDDSVPLSVSSPSASASASAAPTKEDHKTKNLNLLLLRVKEKLAALQIDYDKQGKKLSDLEAAHAKLQTQHINLTAKAKLNDEQLTAKLNAAIATGKADSEALNAKLVKLKSDMQRSASVMQSELQDEICTLQSNLQVTQAGLSSSQHILESERTRLGGLLTQTQQELKESRALADSALLELRGERETRMRAQYALSDKSKECDGHIFRAKRLDERCVELSDATQIAKQAVAKNEQESETWRQRYMHMRQIQADTKKNLRHYKLLLRYASIATFAGNFKMKKLMLAVHDKVQSLCAEAITQPDVPPGQVPGTAPPGGRAAAKAHTAIDGTSERIKQRGSGEFASPPATANGDTSGRSPILFIDGGAANANDSTIESPTSNVNSLSPPSTAPHMAAAVVIAAQMAGKPLVATTGNMGSLPRYSVGPIGLTDREWEIHVADLARRSDLQGRPSNMHLLHLIEDKLSILSPVVGELRCEVLSSRSTSEGMFQRTLQLSRKNMQVTAKLEREKAKTEALRMKLAVCQRDAKRLKRIEYMYNRLTDKDMRGPGSGPPPPPVIMKELLALDRDAGDGVTVGYAAPKGAGRRRKPNEDLDAAHDPNGARSHEEKELSAVLAGTIDDLAYLDTSSDDDDGAHPHSPSHLSPLSPSAQSRRKTAPSGTGPGTTPIGISGVSAHSKRASTTPASGNATPVHAAGTHAMGGGVVYSWKEKKPIRESILPSTSPSVAGPTTAVRSPTRASTPGVASSAVAGGGTKFPPAGPNSARTAQSQSQSQSTKSYPLNMWQNVPSPPQTAAGRDSLGSQSSRTHKATGARAAVYVGSSTAREVDEKDHHHSLQEANHTNEDEEEISRAGVTAAIARRSRNPYAVSSRIRRSEKSPASGSAASSSSAGGAPRPSSGSRPRTQHGMSPLMRPATTPAAPAASTASAGAPRLHALNNPANVTGTTATAAAANTNQPNNETNTNTTQPNTTEEEQ